MGEPSLTTDLGRVLITGGSGFLGANLAETLLDRGYRVRSFDRVPSPLPEHPELEVLEGDICDADTVAQAMTGIDTVFHTAAIIDLAGGPGVTDELRRRSYAVNVEGTKNIAHLAAQAGAKRFIYVSSNSVVLGEKPISGGDETLPYTSTVSDLYTETKIAAEKFILAENGRNDLLTCAIRPSGIWGKGDQTMFRRLFESVAAGHVRVLIGSRHARLDNSYVHNLIHGLILAAQHLVPGGAAPGQAYFVNDDDPVNLFDFARPIVEACGERWPKLRVPGPLVHAVMKVWQRLHYRFGISAPLLQPGAVKRIYLNNYFSVAKARRDLGYNPPFTTEQAMADCLPYYIDLFKQIEADTRPQLASVVGGRSARIA